jgi:hypothetical protein
MFDQIGRVSLITLFDNIEVRPSAGQELPPVALIPKEWGVFAQWVLLPEEKGEKFSQGIEVLYPDEKVFLTQTIPLDSSRERVNVGANFQGFPVGQPGFYRINVWLNQEGSKVTEKFSTGINVIIKPLAPGETPPQTFAVKANPPQ